VRLRMGRRDFFGEGFQLLNPPSNRACQWRLPSIADELPGGALNRHGPSPLLPGSRQLSSWVYRLQSPGPR
jgi:hypothetical protein